MVFVRLTPGTNNNDKDWRPFDSITGTVTRSKEQSTEGCTSSFGAQLLSNAWKKVSCTGPQLTKDQKHCSSRLQQCIESAMELLKEKNSETPTSEPDFVFETNLTLPLSNRILSLVHLNLKPKTSGTEGNTSFLGKTHSFNTQTSSTRLICSKHAFWLVEHRCFKGISCFASRPKPLYSKNKGKRAATPTTSATNCSQFTQQR